MELRVLSGRMVEVIVLSGMVEVVVAWVVEDDSKTGWGGSLDGTTRGVGFVDDAAEDGAVG